MSVTEELYGLLEKAAFDPAFITQFKRRLLDTGLWEAMGCSMPRQKKNVAPPAAPLASSITAIRAGLWDNWPEGMRTKKHPNRYALTMELWTLPGDEIEAVRSRSLNHEFKTSMSLMDRKALKAQVRVLGKPRVNPLSTVDPDYLDMLLEVSSELSGYLIGMVNTNIATDDSDFARGVYYPAFQFVLVKIEDGRVMDARFLNEDVIDLAPFVVTDCNDDPLKGVIAQSRLDRVGFDDSWATNSK